MDEDNGAFSDFVRQDLDLTWQVPDKMTDVQAATMPIPFFTACQVFYQRMGLPQTVPSPHGKWMLVYSGASSVGQYAIQLAKRSGFNVVATASPSRESRLKSLGADAVVDYHVRAHFCPFFLFFPSRRSQGKLSTPVQAHDLAQKLKDATNDGITNAIDCFAEGESSKVCHDAMSCKCLLSRFFFPLACTAPSHSLRLDHLPTASQGGEVVAILPIPDNAISRKDVKASATILYTNLSGKPVKFGPAEFPPAGPHDREDAARFYEFFPQFAVDSGIKYLDVHELQGIEKIPEGLKLLQEGKVHGKKIVVKA